MLITECQYVGPEQDPMIHYPLTYCGCKVVAGKSYCAEHYWTVYKKGTAIAGRKKEKMIEAELAEIKKVQEIEEIENE